MEPKNEDKSTSVVDYFNKPDLKPCPFCGLPGYAFRDEHGDFYVGCGDRTIGCHVETFTWAVKDLDDAVAMWNQRAEEGRIANLEAQRDNLFNENKALYRQLIAMQQMLDEKARKKKERH